MGPKIRVVSVVIISNGSSKNASSHDMGEDGFWAQGGRLLDVELQKVIQKSGLPIRLKFKERFIARSWFRVYGLISLS